MDGNTSPTPSRPRWRQSIDRRGVRGAAFAGAHSVLRRIESKINPHPTPVTTRFAPLTRLDDPIEAVYRAAFKTAVVSIPLDSLRWSRLGLPVTAARNPFVATVLAHRAATETTYDGSVLQRYYEGWTPATVGEALGLDGTGHPTLEQPAASVALPWSAEAGRLDPTERLELVEKWNRRESAVAGLELGREHGHKHFGPVTPQFGALEYERYTRLADVVARDGFVPYKDDEYVGVQILATETTWVALATGPGLHRSIVAAALDVEPLVVAVDKRPTIVHRTDAPSWPGVRSGLFDLDTALAVFDRLIDGSPPAGFPQTF